MTGRASTSRVRRARRFNIALEALLVGMCVWGAVTSPEKRIVWIVALLGWLVALIQNVVAEMLARDA